MRFVLQFFVSFYVINMGYLISDTTSNPNVAGEDDSREIIMDPQAEHTFVSLLDIVFTDGSKRTCTGTIIHESVVITAAHCFTNPDNEMAKPELLASFVVIGTKKMFGTGYEHYLPIEKILIHPKYQGWTADLALVYTFASMTGHKPGSILPLAGERTSTHVDANVTVLSWGSSELVDDVWKKYGSKVASDCDSDDDDKGPLRIRSPGLQTMLPYNMNVGQKDSEESETVFKSRRDKKKTKHALRSDPPSMREEKAKRYLGKEEEQINVITTEDDLGETLQSNEEVVNGNDFVTEPAFLADKPTSSKHNIPSKNKSPSKNILPESVYGKRRSGIGEWPQSIYVNSKRFAEILNEKKTQSPYQNFRRFDQNYKGLSIYRKPEGTPQPTMGSFEIKSHYKNWRRLMGTQQNQLKVEIFGFVNQKICEANVEKEMPPEFYLGNKNDVVCFSADEQFITDDDSGASVVRQGKLIAVAIGGVGHENEHVAIGMKMSCYCSWIVENLPEPKPDMACCYNCCEVTHLKDGISPPQARYESETKKIISF